MSPICIHPLHGIGEIVAGDDLASMLVDALAAQSLVLEPTDVLVVAQKVVSKAEDRFLDLAAVTPGERAHELAAVTAKDPRVVQAILDESTEVLRARPNVLIVRHRLGWVMAHAGVDRSNVPGTDRVLLLPRDPDASAAALRERLHAATGVRPGVIVSDSFGRPWRLGTTNVALGAAGVPSLWDRRGERDRNGRTLEATVIAWADAVAAAAGLALGEASEGVPAALVRGLHCPAPERPARALVRPLEEDMFR